MPPPKAGDPPTPSGRGALATGQLAPPAAGVSGPPGHAPVAGNRRLRSGPRAAPWVDYETELSHRQALLSQFIRTKYSGAKVSSARDLPHVDEFGVGHPCGHQPGKAPEHQSARP